jgi:hypothetical protein
MGIATQMVMWWIATTRSSIHLPPKTHGDMRAIHARALTDLDRSKTFSGVLRIDKSGVGMNVATANDYIEAALKDLRRSAKRSIDIPHCPGYLDAERRSVRGW